MEAEHLVAPPQFVLQAFDRDILRGPSQSVQTGYIEDVGQRLLFKVQIFDEIRVMLTRGICARAGMSVARCNMDLHAARLMLEGCRYRLNWTLYRRQGWYVMVHRAPLEGMVIAEPIEAIAVVEKPSWITAWRQAPDWAMDIKLARIANEPAGDRRRQDVFALRDHP